MVTQWAEAANFRPPPRGSLAQHITDQLRRRIVSGDLRPGRRLPPIRKLARLYEVSPPTMESAIHALATLGFVRTKRGVGTFVAEPRDQTTLLNYVWRQASIDELAIIRATIDERAAPLLAARLRHPRTVRLPQTLGDINFLVHERSVNRYGDPEQFIRADFAFHGAVVATLRGFEIGGALYERIGNRLEAPMMAVADLQSADSRLDTAHLQLSAAVLDGEVLAAARLARAVARDELRSLEGALG